MHSCLVYVSVCPFVLASILTGTIKDLSAVPFSDLHSVSPPPRLSPPPPSFFPSGHQGVWQRRAEIELKKWQGEGLGGWVVMMTLLIVYYWLQVQKQYLPPAIFNISGQLTLYLLSHTQAHSELCHMSSLTGETELKSGKRRNAFTQSSISSPTPSHHSPFCWQLFSLPPPSFIPSSVTHWYFTADGVHGNKGVSLWQV